MRRLLGGVVLVAGCFNPSGGGGSTSDSPPASTSDSPHTSGSADPANDTTTLAPTTTVGATAEPTTGVEPTSGTMTRGTTTAGTTMGPGCEEACGTCQACKDGECVLLDKGEECEAPPDSCQDIVWGLANGTCYAAKPTMGMCQAGGECTAACTEQGEPLFGCASAVCVRPDHNCSMATPASQVTLDTLCSQSGEQPEGCMRVCDGGGSYPGACQAGGTCAKVEMSMGTDCGVFVCDGSTGLCKVECKSFADCIPGYSCNVLMKTCEPI